MEGRYGAKPFIAIPHEVCEQPNDTPLNFILFNYSHPSISEYSIAL
jgi:hypothetical protein